MSESLATDDLEDRIAVVGMGCRFPGGVSDPGGFWELLAQGRDAVGELPADRWDAAAWHHPDPSVPGRTYTRAAGCLEGDIRAFDAEFFGLSAREASRIDPQHRLLLEVAWEALEDAGRPPLDLAGRPVGVFVGVCTVEYGEIQKRDPASMNSYTNAGGSGSLGANRISYHLDLRGPSVAVDTACSSSLVALHLGCESLRRGESELALVGGVHLLLNPAATVGFCRASMLSRAGHCQAFDARADGFVRAEGAGMVVLTPLARALANGDRIYAVIRGTGVNQAGKTSGISLPGEASQRDLIGQVLRRANVAPAAVQYVEAHGTGTPAGDPIECRALGAALGDGRGPANPCRIGSVKTNLGHLEGASGMPGLMKLALALRQRQLPASLHFQTPNPNIDFVGLNLAVQSRLEAWPDNGDAPRTAGISSFGFGGSNAHAVLEEAPTGEPALIETAESDTAELLVLSGRSVPALEAQVRNHAEWLDARPGEAARDVCAAAARHRSHLEHRIAVVGRSTGELGQKLRARIAAARTEADGHRASEVRLAFVYSGNGPQWWGMARGLLRQEPTFREAVERCDLALTRFAGWSLMEELARDESRSRMDQTSVAQPALFAVQYGLTEVLRSWGVVPAAVAGHSVGEVAAALAAGALSFDDAVRVIYHRSRTQEQTAGRGKMAAVGLSAPEAEKAIARFGGRLSVAAFNSPGSVTLSGDGDALADLAAELESRQVFCRILRLGYAFHCPAMDSIRDELLSSLGGLAPRPTRIPLVSTVLGTEIEGEQLGADYWWRNVRQPVRFDPAVRALAGQGADVFLEIGPHPVLGGYVKESLAAEGRRATVLPSLRRQEDDLTVLLSTLGALHVAGLEVNWSGVYPGAVRHLSLPRYPWQREPHWNETAGGKVSRQRVHSLLGARLEGALPGWENDLDLRLQPYLRDHQLQGAVVFPAAGHVELALAAAREVFGDGPCQVEELDIRKALTLSEGQAPTVQVVSTSEEHAFSVCVRQSDQSWVPVATFQVGRPTTPGGPKPPTNLAVIRERLLGTVTPESLYRATADCGLNYGPAFQGVREVRTGVLEALGEIRLPVDPGDCRVHPALLDACFQVVFAAVTPPGGQPLAYLPVRIERFRFHGDCPPVVYCHTRVRRQTTHFLLVDVDILDRDGRVIAEIEGFHLQAVELSDRTTELPLTTLTWEEASGSAVSLPTPSQVEAEVGATITAIAESLDRERFYTSFRPRSNQLCAAYVWQALQVMGASGEVGDRIAPRDLLPGPETPRHLQSYLHRLMGMLEDEQVVRRAEDAWEVVGPGNSLPSPDSLWRTLVSEMPAYHAELALLRRVGQRLTGILRGQVEPLQLIFANSSEPTAEHLYSAGPYFRFYNQTAQEAVATLVKHLPAGRTLRLLELGAGTGGTTEALLAVLPPDRTRYTFTDVSEAFLSLARNRFQQYPFVDYQVLDVDRDPLAQGHAAHTFDLIVCSNVLYASRDPSRTLSQLRRLLVSGGGLLAAEILRGPARFIDLVFGPLPGWCGGDDAGPESGCLSLTEQGWRALFAETGFTEVAALHEGQLVERPEQAVFLARGPVLDAAEVVCAGEPTTWLVLSSGGGFGDQVRDRLRQAGQTGIDVRTGGEPYGPKSYHHRLKPGSTEDVVRLLADWKGGGVQGILILPREGAASPGASLPASPPDVCLDVLRLVQCLLDAGWETLPRLCVVTAGAEILPSESATAGVLGAPLWGLVRVIRNEHPELQTRLIDVGSACGPDEASALLAEATRADGEPEVLLRGRRRFLHRLRPVHLGAGGALREASVEPDAQFRLEIPTRGLLERLTVRRRARPEPARGEVEIEVRAAGLNFKDVMWATGMLTGEAMEGGFAGAGLGLECAGVIRRVGPGVADYRPGDEVFAFAPWSFARFTHTPASSVAAKPASMTFEEAATVPVVYLTAYYGLIHLARLEPGERVLIHGAAGGVGLAAIQIVRLFGGQVFATAGSAEKRDYLRALGVEHVFDSRTLAFADDIRSATGGAGVDVVLNSLAGEAVTRNLQILRPFGRFLEIGKRDYLENRKVGLRPFLENISYFAIDADRLMAGRPETAQRLLHAISGHLGRGELRPLPHRTFSLTDAAHAFRHMQRSRHIGKVVLSVPRRLPVAPEAGEAIHLRQDGSYLVTGGLGGFGLALARWLVERGAGHLVLLGRQGAATPESRGAVEALRLAGATVDVARVDVTQAEALARLLAEVRRERPPIRGVFHAAMVLADCAVRNLDAERLTKVLGPKVVGGWNLHLQTLADPLDHFVQFSSISSVVGNPGQANYAAANAFLDALARHRRAAGRPALTVNWGVIGEVGYVSQREALQQRFAAAGIRPLPASSALRCLGRLMARPEVGQVVGADIDWRRWAKAPNMAPSSALWAELSVEPATGQEEEAPGGRGFREVLQQTAADQVPALLGAHLTDHIAKVLGVARDRVDLEKSFTQMGLDSLMAVELRLRILEDVGLDVPVMTLLQDNSGNKLVDSLAARLDTTQTDAADPGTTQPAMPTEGEPIQGLRPADPGPADWLTGQRLLLTGASGFVGKALLEKILWAAPGVERVFVLLRARDSRGAEERLAEVLAAPAFHRLRSRHGPAFARFCREKLVAVAGDVAQDKLGIAASEYQRLAGSLTAIVHAAASVNFDERWDIGLEVNALGPLRVLRLAQDAGNIPLVHLSTCYVSGNRHGRIEEALAPLDPAFLQLEDGSQAAPNLHAWVERHLDECRALSRAVEQGLYDVEVGPPSGATSRAAARRNWLARRLVEQGREHAQRLGWNDTYTLTKALGEHLLAEQRGTVPLRLVRPSIIASTFAEPMAGWLVGIKICDPVILAMARGLSCFVGNPDLTLDMIPCDLVVNATLAVLEKRSRRGGVEFYQVATSEQNPLRQEVMAQAVREGFERRSLPTDHLKAPTLVSAPEFYEYCEQLCRTLPPDQQGDVDRYRYFAHLYSFYTLTDFCYAGGNTRQLFESLSAEERRLYPFNVTAFDWRTYFLDSHLPGLFRLAAGLGLDADAAVRNNGAARASGHGFALAGRPAGGEG